MKSFKTYQQKNETIDRKWHVVDLKGQVLGRVSTEIAKLLIGKHKPEYTTHVDTGDYVVVINASAVEVTGNKETDKTYYRHSMYPGGFRQETYDKLKARDPKQIIEKAVYGMLPKNKLRSERMRRLKIFVGADHIYADKLK